MRACELKPAKAELKSLEDRVEYWISFLNDCIISDSYKHPYDPEKTDTGTQFPKEDLDVVKHPKFTKYLKDLVQAGYWVKISEPTDFSVIQIVWDPEMPATLIWYDYDKDMKAHNAWNLKRELFYNNLMTAGMQKDDAKDCTILELQQLYSWCRLLRLSYIINHGESLLH